MDEPIQNLRQKLPKTPEAPPYPVLDVSPDLGKLFSNFTLKHYGMWAATIAVCHAVMWLDASRSMRKIAGKQGIALGIIFGPQFPLLQTRNKFLGYEDNKDLMRHYRPLTKQEIEDGRRRLLDPNIELISPKKY